MQAELDEADRAFIERQFLFFLATVDAGGFPNCSFKGGSPGFVRVLDSKTLAFPDYNGNGMFLSLGNLSETRRVGLLFVDFLKPGRIRVNGDAGIDPADPLLSEYPGAQMIVRVAVREAFPNCSRYIPQMEVVEPSAFLPKEGQASPVPEWKRSDWAREVLPGEPMNSSEP